MGFLDSIERLITEHGSAAILRERISLLNDQHAHVVEELRTSKEQCVSLVAETDRLRIETARLEGENAKLRAQIQHLGNQPKETYHLSNPKRYACDGCGGTAIRRTGARPNAMFSAVGIKDLLFSCPDCGKESAFIDD